MDRETFVKVLEHIRRGCNYAVHGNSDGSYVLEWNDTSVTAPTDEELQVGVQAIEAIKYREERAKEYPSVTDQLDAIWKGGDAAADMLAKVQAVKSKYPKPS